jgi:pimeloyl-ACP methyl ester carboxylesterase
MPIDGTIEANGVGLKYLEWSGPSDRTLLVIPGNGWRHSFSYLGGIWAARSRVVVLGVRGLAESESAEPYTWEAVVSDIGGAATKLAIDGPLVMVGGQGASAWALLYAARHPDTVTHVITLDYEIPTGPEGASGRRHRGKTWPSLEAASEEVIARWNVPADHRTDALAALAHFFVRRPDGLWQWPGGVRPGTHADLCEFYVCEPELRPLLRQVERPVLVMFGSSVGEYAAGVLSAELRDHEVHKVDGGGHLLQLSAPDTVARITQDWLSRKTPRRNSYRAVR